MTKLPTQFYRSLPELRNGEFRLFGPENPILPRAVNIPSVAKLPGAAKLSGAISLPSAAKLPSAVGLQAANAL